MRPPLYVEQLRKDLQRWVDEGIISGPQRQAILEDVDREGTGRPVTDWLALIGAILVVSGIVAVVAANWDGLTRLMRLVALCGGLVVSYAAAVAFLRTGRRALGQAFVLIGVGMFGGTVMLFGQTYHFNADYPDGVLIWGLGALGAAALVPSRAALAAAFVLGALWTYIEAVEYTPELHWPYLLYLLAACTIVYALKWWAGFHLVLLSAVFWLVGAADHLERAIGFPDEPVAYALIAYAAMLIGLWRDARPARIAASYGAIVFVALACFDYGAWLDVGTAGVPDFATDPDTTVRTLPLGLLIVLGLAALALVLAVSLRKVGLVAAAMGALVLLNVVVLPWSVRHVGVIVPVLAFWAAMVFVLLLGVQNRNRVLLNTALAGFIAGVAITYFVLLGSLLETGVFFLTGGALFIVLSFLVTWLNRRLAPARGAEHRPPVEGR